MNKQNFNISEIKDVDPLFFEAGKAIIERESASTGMVMRILRTGYNRTNKIMEQLESAGVLSAEEGTRPRKILMSHDEFLNFEINYKGGFKEYVPAANSAFPEAASNSEHPRFTLYNNKYDYMDGNDFEQFCAYLLIKNGFQEVSITQASNDQGIDIVAEKDGVRYGIQCKRYSNDIGNHAVQEAFAGAKFYDCHVAAVLTNRFFTRQAKELAAKNRVLLWDRDTLELYIQNAVANKN